jgi:microsomal dipeptidase-like Zn-dependent dipeptidase
MQIAMWMLGSVLHYSLAASGPIERPVVPALGACPVGATDETPVDRAHRLHEDSLIVLAHDHNFRIEDFADMRAGGVTAKVLKLTTDGIDWNRATGTRYTVPRQPIWAWTNRFRAYLHQVQNIADDPANRVAIIRKHSDIELAKRRGLAGAIIGSEGALQLGEDDQWRRRVREFYDAGWRETQLRWSGNANLFVTAQNELTPDGVALIGECNRLGILIDVSHLPLPLVQQIVDRSSAPVIRSHDTPIASGVGGEATDELIASVVGSGGGHGVFALHFYSDYYSGEPSLDRLVRAARHVIDRFGINHVALGADFFPEPGKWVIPTIREMPQVTMAFVQAGFSDDEIRGILGLNLLWLYERAWDRH